MLLRKQESYYISCHAHQHKSRKKEAEHASELFGFSVHNLILSLYGELA